MKQKLTLLILALFTTVGAWATDYVVTVTTTSVDPNTKGVFANVAAPDGYFTTWTSNAESGLEGLIISTSGNLGIKSQYVNTTNYGTVLALKTTTSGGETPENFTITAPTGYYIKGYSLEAKRYSSSNDNYTIQSIGGKNYTSIGTSTSTTFTEAAPYASSVTLKVTDTKNMSSNYLCFVSLTVTLTDALPGTRLNSTADGVTWNNGNNPKNWNNTWTSGTSIDPTVTIKCGASVGANDRGNMQSGSNVAGSFYLHTNNSPYYTISVPYGYIIKKYTIVGAGTDSFTFTNSEGVKSGELSQKMMTEIIVSGCNKNVVSFLVSPAGHALDDATIFLDIASFGDLTVNDLSDLSNTKAYNIMNARGTWNFADDATAMSALGTSSVTDLSAASRSIAIIYYDKTDNGDDTDGNYYLFSVNAGKYLTANNTLTSMPTDAEQVDIVATGSTSYPWFFRFKTVNGEGKYTKNINISSGTIKIDGWGPDGSNALGCLDDGNCNAIVEVADFDATQALEMFNVRTVTYNLNFEGGSTLDTESDVTVTVGGDPADFVPSRFTNPFVTFSYSPATIAAETTEVTVTATWNGPFQISDNYASAVWQVVQMHTYPGYPAEKWSWSYKSDDSDKVKPEQVLEYDAVTTNRLFCFVGNPYEGFKIYNAAAGSDYTLTRSGESDEISMASGDHIFTLHQSAASPDASTYFALKPSGATNFVNFDYTNKKIAGWDVADNGSTCWVVAPGQYYLDFIDGLYLDAPVGAVGTRAYFQSVANAETEKDNIRGYRTTVAANMYSNELGSLNTLLDPVKATDVITLSDGYYRIVNAYPNWATNAPTIYYNSEANRIEWSKASNTPDNVNSIFKIDASTPSIYSPNAQKYMSAISSSVSGSLDDTPGTTVFTSLGSAQYNVVVGGGTMHTAGHSSGAGNSGNLTSWGGGVNEASAWYLVKVSTLTLSLNSDGAGNYYATLFLPFDATISGADAFTLAKSGNYLVPTAVTDNKVPAGTPVLLKGTNATATATINTGAAFSPIDPGALTGTYVDITTARSTGEYILGMKGDVVGFYQRGDGKKIGANKAYLSLGSDISSSVKGFVLMFDDDATGINSLTPALSEGEGAIYNGAGQRISKMQKGINIVNGKKILK